MRSKPPKNNERYFWTGHALGKMRYYGLTAQRILRVINHPVRIEEGVAENTTAVMQPASINRKSAPGGKSWNSEIWAMYKLLDGRYKIISAWRYPGVSPKRNYLPAEIMEEVKDK
ncbi:MAG: hypothetical protein PHS62_05120 [Patescibacteria group bacterium]|nr:hypothetical protein [Patescibacteria group bacterium]